MHCPACTHVDTKVLESRLSHEGRTVRRRRRCQKCNHRFTTYEREEVVTIQVEKSDGSFEPFSQEKALKGIQIACQKRPVTMDQMEGIVSHIERSVHQSGERSIFSTRIGELIMIELRGIDQVAYVRFASVYKDFKDSESFAKELESLKDD